MHTDWINTYPMHPLNVATADKHDDAICGPVLTLQAILHGPQCQSGCNQV